MMVSQNAGTITIKINELPDLRRWGWAPGDYTINCQDCPKDIQLFENGGGAKHARLCFRHALLRMQEASEVPPIKFGLRLLTKDGSRIGNAILYAGGNPLESPDIFLVETDFGNKTRFTWEEINEYFTIGGFCDYKEWAADRDELRKKDDGIL